MTTDPLSTITAAVSALDANQIWKSGDKAKAAHEAITQVKELLAKRDADLAAAIRQRDSLAAQVIESDAEIERLTVDLESSRCGVELQQTEIERLTNACNAAQAEQLATQRLNALLEDHKEQAGKTIMRLEAELAELQKFNDAANAECQRLRELPCAECAVLRERLQECEK